MVSKPSKLDLRLGYLVVRDAESTVRVYLSEITVLIIENTASSITTALLNELAKQKIKVVFCDEKQNPSSELTPYYGCHDCSLKLKSQLQWLPQHKGAVWTAIVKQKIKMQAQVLAAFQLQEAERLCRYIEEVAWNDETNREGHAAKVYFNALFGKTFSRNEESPINAALNYGYSVILACFNREIVCNGYLTQLGLFHDNRFNAFNLGCDLMEPFRPVIDRMVKQMQPKQFETAEKRHILTVLNLELYIDGKKQTLLNTVKLYAKSVFEAIESGDAAALKFYQYEL